MNQIKYWVGGIALAVPLTACGINTCTAKLNTPTLTPTKVVKQYYQLINKQDVACASQFLDKSLVALQKQAPDSDFNNVVSISNIQVSGPYDVRLNQQFLDEVQVAADFDAQYKQVITDYSGYQTRFIYLGRNNDHEPWRIIAIGTGP